VIDKPRKQIHLGARFPGVNGSEIEFDSLVHFARTAERGLFDFFLLDDLDDLDDLDVVGRPDTFTVLAALAAVTDRLGLVGTINTTFNEPFEVARQFATLDHLSDGRAAWNMATSSDADRYHRAEEFVAVVRQFWDSWAADAVIADRDTGVYVDPDRIRTVRHRGPHFDVRGVATLPRAPQGHPVLLQAGDSPDGRTFAAKHADALFTVHSDVQAGRDYCADVKARAAEHGRDPNRLKVLHAATFELGDAADVADEIDLQVQNDACDGFILTPRGLDKFVDRVVPLLQERGSFRTEYAGHTLRDHLGL
jgi:FMN-dependent oxidoreductase (nitrilotriacetate monooxygenase family)